MNATPTPPDVLEYLDDLRASGVTNMFGAGAYVQRDFGVDRDTARTWVLDWMDTFSERHPPPEPAA